MLMIPAPSACAGGQATKPSYTNVLGTRTAEERAVILQTTNMKLLEYYFTELARSYLGLSLAILLSDLLL